MNRIIKFEKGKVFVAFVDFRKAYDKVNRDMLLLKLQRLGVKGLLYDNIKQIYNSITYMVKVTGGYTSPISSTLGLKQGGILSSLLFNIYSDDIKSIFVSSYDPINFLNNPLSHLLYADEMTIMSSTSNGLSNCLEKLSNYCDTWHLDVNISKTEIIIFNSSGKILKGCNFSSKHHTLNI